MQEISGQLYAIDSFIVSIIRHFYLNEALKCDYWLAESLQSVLIPTFCKKSSWKNLYFAAICYLLFFLLLHALLVSYEIWYFPKFVKKFSYFISLPTTTYMHLFTYKCEKKISTEMAHWLLHRSRKCNKYRLISKYIRITWDSYLMDFHRSAKIGKSSEWPL